MEIPTFRRTHAATGRPIDGDQEAVESLTDDELEREVALAALTSKRSKRYEVLAAEQRRRANRPNRA